MNDRAFAYMTFVSHTIAHTLLEERVRAAADIDKWVIYTTGLDVTGAPEACLLETRPLDPWLRSQIARVATSFRATPQTLVCTDAAGRHRYDVPILDNRGAWTPLPVCVSFFFTRRARMPRHLSSTRPPLEHEADAGDPRIVCVIDRVHLKAVREPPLGTWTVVSAVAMRFPSYINALDADVVDKHDDAASAGPVAA